jgi:hypothetical protein
MGSAPEPQEETMRACGPQNAILAAVCGSLGLLLTACGGLFDSGDSKAGLSCIDDSPECVEQRQMTLKSMLADKNRSWVREAPTPQAHASGVRLFAFRAQKKEMNCEELGHARREADSAARTLRGPDGKGLSPAQISRATMFAAEVSKELSAEMRSRRCKA